MYRRKKQVRICFVSSFPPSRGRLSEYAFALINSLQKHSEITKIDILGDTINGKTTVPISDKTVLHRVWKPEKPVSLLMVPMYILRIRPDIVHFNLHMAVFGRGRLSNFIGLGLPLLCRLMGLRVLVTLHNITERIDLQKTGFSNSFINKIGALFATKLLTLSNMLTVTVKSYVELLRTKYKCKNVVWIPHGTWYSGPLNSDCGEKDTILYIGHHGPYKDLELLSKSYHLIRKNRRVKLIIAGSSHPDYPNLLEEWYDKSPDKSDDMDFLGYVPEQELPKLFGCVSVVVLPYYTCTGTSGVAHLASLFGTPIVATDLPEFRDLVSSGCGIVLSGHTPEELAGKIESILDRTTLVQELRNKNNCFAKQRSWDVIASQFCTLYANLLDGKKLPEEVGNGP